MNYDKVSSVGDQIMKARAKYKLDDKDSASTRQRNKRIKRLKKVRQTIINNASDQKLAELDAKVKNCKDIDESPSITKKRKIKRIKCVYDPYQNTVNIKGELDVFERAYLSRLFK